MKSANDFYGLMMRARELKREMDFPPLNGTLTKEDMSEFLGELLGYFKEDSVVVSSKEIDEAKRLLEGSMKILHFARNCNDMEVAKSSIGDAIIAIDDALDPYLEKCVVG